MYGGKSCEKPSSSTLGVVWRKKYYTKALEAFFSAPFSPISYCYCNLVCRNIVRNWIYGLEFGRVINRNVTFG